MGYIRGICISKERGTAKHEVESAKFIPDWGIEGDAHAGHWHRQVSLLSLEKRVSDNLWALRSMPFEIVEIY